MKMTIYLTIDNVGGHGNVPEIKTYKKTSLDKFNIKIIHQVPNSPETNLLDLGV